ncbi:outer dense fiber protein 3 isoform X2 [Monodon monoceros]|uniref:Ciliary microtubule associated protein 1A n=2 Tax=Monodontidae TaxID=9747 RepID=A0A8C6CJI1_MONMO|nr:outer dense fiber protein 3 isoform X2 [Delphinapterus leucas]XP_029065090.1 outer dense fiber protein 3 isoform X2 [Monodon monoceros]
MAEEVWVGTWRPHRPRGPIMALYSSPGPKYLIPPTTGFVKHTPDKLRAPAYSFHGAPTLLAENCSPGPRYSVNPKILRTGKDIGPAYSILGRYCTKTTLTPGPGHYFPEKSTKHVFDSAPSHSISARTKTFRVDSTPGPAAYMLPVVMGPHTVGKASQPAFSIKGRSKLGSFSDDLYKVTVTKPCAPIVTFGIKHSDYMTPLVVDVE